MGPRAGSFVANRFWGVTRFPFVGSADRWGGAHPHDGVDMEAFDTALASALGLTRPHSYHLRMLRRALAAIALLTVGLVSGCSSPSQTKVT